MNSDDPQNEPKPVGQSEQAVGASQPSTPPEEASGTTATEAGQQQEVPRPSHPSLAPPLKPVAETESDSDDEAIEEEPKGGGGLKSILGFFITVGLVIAIVHYFIFQAFYVSGSSMNPDFQDGDYLIIDKVGTTMTSIKGVFGIDTSQDLKRGDVLVFRYPNNPSTFFIKRLIGLPGDRVIVKDGKVTIINSSNPDGLTLQEPYIDPTEVTQGDIDQVVDKNKYFVMGDNRAPNGSFDSREWGQLPKENVVGVATARLLPVNELGPIKHPTY